MNNQRLIDQIEELRSLRTETPWLEFKISQEDPVILGKTISALSNSARIKDRETAFIVWGIEDKTYSVKGTKFDPFHKKVGNQNFELWLSNKLNPAPKLNFDRVDHPDGQLIILTISASIMTPTAFENTPYIRVGSSTTKLTEKTNLYQSLIEKLRPYSWEKGVALSYISDTEVLNLLNYSAYFDLIGRPVPTSDKEVLNAINQEELIQRDVGDKWNILNLGAILFANDFKKFGTSIERKGIRFFRYDGRDKSARVTHQRDYFQGYASGFEELMNYVNGFIPQDEKFSTAIRKSYPLFPLKSLRELISNALIHQDMTITGAGPMIELFSDRIEISNPGSPLVVPNRMVDHPPRSRNEAIGRLMRRMGICEERGSGLDKVFLEVENYHLPAPRLSASSSAMQVILYGPKGFVNMSVEERIYACYWHSVICYINGGQRMKNSSLCKRFGINGGSSALATSVIKKAIDAKVIKMAHEGRPRLGYLPFWA